MSNTRAKESGILTSELDPAVRPQDDLFRYVNGKWIDRTQIPSDKARYGSFYLLAEEAEKAVREIIEEAATAQPGTEERKFGDVYASFMDEKRIAQLGARLIRRDLRAIDPFTVHVSEKVILRSSERAR
jgi:putative endopeptidase